MTDHYGEPVTDERIDNDSLFGANIYWEKDDEKVRYIYWFEKGGPMISCGVRYWW